MRSLYGLVSFSTLLFLTPLGGYATHCSPDEFAAIARNGPDGTWQSYLEKAGLRLKVSPVADAPFNRRYVFTDESGAVVSESSLMRTGGSRATAEIRIPRLQGGIPGDDFLKLYASEIAADAEGLGFQQVAIPEFQNWKKGNLALQRAGYLPEDSANSGGRFVKTLKGRPVASSITSLDSKRQYFRDLAAAVERRRPELEKLLAEVNTPEGTRYEINQVIDALKNAENLELQNLQGTRVLKNTTVYASTNVPLYSLVLQGFFPLSVSKNVWFRTPQTTRGLYARIFEILQKELPPDRLNGFHLLTAERDVQYDQFRNIHILGLNSNGKFARDPAEFVIFTGSPDTGKGIVNQISRKLEQLDSGDREFKQVFAGFGSGMNPMIVTSSAVRKMDRAIEATVENLRINCSQDCSLPNFYAVHKDVSKAYVSGIVKRIGSPKSALNAPLTPLTMTKDFGKLVHYREKYAKYLINKDAILDPEAKLVSPHVFVFPESLFNDVELQEHFAPFISIFKYASNEGLDRMIRDERVRKQAMFATVFGGDKATPAFSDAVLRFQESGHEVWVNRNLYSTESANMPFGGSGVDTSFVYTFTKSPGASVEVTRGHYPTLFSQEASFHFPQTIEGQTGLPGRAPQFYQEELERVVANARTPPWVSRGDWKNLQNPLLSDRPHGIDAIRVKAKQGFAVAIGDATPTPEVAREQERFYGVPLIFTGDGKKPTFRKGVVLHVQDMNDGVNVLNGARGELSPNAGYGYLYGMLQDKLTEFRVAEAIWPGVMPKSYVLNDLKEIGTLTPELLKRKSEVLSHLNEVLKRKKPLTESQRTNLRTALQGLVRDLFEATRKSFPEGAYFKNFGEFATGDLNLQITTFSSSYQGIADQFLRRFEAVLEEPASITSLFDSGFGRSLGGTWEMGGRFVHTFLTDPDKILIQSRVRVARTSFGYPKEFRVDFIDGEAVIARPRFTSEYMPEDLEKAKKLVDDFFQRAPKEFRYLSGGADVATLVDGRNILFEFNFGPAGGTRFPGYYPIESHQYLSTLKGSPTLFLKGLDEVFSAGLSAQKKHLSRLKHERGLWWRTGKEDLSVEDIGHYFRDRHLEAWVKDGARKEIADRVLQDIDSLFDGYTSDPILRLKEGATQFIREKIGRGGTLRTP